MFNSPEVNNFIINNIDLLLIEAIAHIIIYIIIVGIFSLFLYKIFKPSSKARILNKEIKSKQIKVELLYTIRTVFIQGLMRIILLGLFITQIYTTGDTSLTYDIMTFIGLVLFHDTYFYWSHRVLHHKKLFKPIHGVHHGAKSPTTFSAYRYTATEAVIQFAFFYVYIYLIPISLEVFFSFILFSSTMNILGHSNVDMLPKWWLKLKIMSTPTFHSMHHEKTNGNFGLYFTFWDKLMNTKFDDYEERFLATKKSNKNEVKNDQI